MVLTNDIVLRPRFSFDLELNQELLLNAFEAQRNLQSDYIVTRLDDHVFIRFPNHNRHYWSPQLHLEVTKQDAEKSTIIALFGPNPTVWTLFMFLHFVVATFFIAFGIWAYSNWSLENSYAIPFSLCLMTFLIWFLLYFIGRLGRFKGKNEMELLHDFMKKTINEI